MDDGSFGEVIGQGTCSGVGGGRCSPRDLDFWTDPVCRSGAMGCMPGRAEGTGRSVGGWSNFARSRLWGFTRSRNRSGAPALLDRHHSAPDPSDTDSARQSCEFSAEYYRGNQLLRDSVWSDDSGAAIYFMARIVGSSPAPVVMRFLGHRHLRTWRNDAPSTLVAGPRLRDSDFRKVHVLGDADGDADYWTARRSATAPLRR